MSTLPYLREVKLEHNYFNGPIPWQFGKMKDLRVLRLEFNKLSGNAMCPVVIAAGFGALPWLHGSHHDNTSAVSAGALVNVIATVA